MQLQLLRLHLLQRLLRRWLLLGCIAARATERNRFLRPWAMSRLHTSSCIYAQAVFM